MFYLVLTMKGYKVFVLNIVLCVLSRNLVNALSSDEALEVTETCCTHGETFAMTTSTIQQCPEADPPDEIETEQLDTCRAALKSCCERQFKQKEECAAGISLAAVKRCSVPKTDIGKTCCEECSFGRWTGESQGKDACGGPAEDEYGPATTLRKNAYYQCCLDAAEKPETTTERKVETTTEKVKTTTEKKIQTTTKKKVETTTQKLRQTCKPESCQHLCNDDDGKVTCQCRDGYRLQADKKSCKDINECGEALDDLCTVEGTVCHNTPGSFKCVPIRKRDVGITCPPGFKRNVVNQVCDDINECQLPRPPCPKYLCRNTIGGYKCAGKPGKPFEEAVPGVTTEPAITDAPEAKNDNICPPGFRAGPNDECVDIEECEEHLDDCQRLSQHCINTHGSYFCQDHVSKRCAPGFKVNDAGICEDIDECEQSTEVCKRTEVCVNMPGAYTCKSKISTLPKLASKKCQEGTRLPPGGSICEDIDECREGTHLCDRFQNCINTFGGHECRCKNGFELDSSGSCVDVDECSLKLDNCPQGLYCLNVLGSFTCTKQPPITSTAPTSPVYEYDYYDSEEDNSTAPKTVATIPTTTTGPETIPTTTPLPTPPPTRPPYKPNRTATTRPPYISRRRPTTTSVPTTTRRHEVPVTPRRPPPRRLEPPVEVTVPTPTNPVTVEKEKDSEGSYVIDTIDIPNNRWTNVIGKERTERPESMEPSFDPNNLHCLNGFERNDAGECADVDECTTMRHICSSLEVCENRSGGYTCNCIVGFRRDPTGWCVVDTTTSTTTTVRTTSTSTVPTTTTELNECESHRHSCSNLEECVPRTRGYTCQCIVGYRRDAGGWCVVDTTTSTTTVATPVTTPERPYTPRRPGRMRSSQTCELGYTFDFTEGDCVDIDECATNKANCSPREECVNVPGGYRCDCGARCRSGSHEPTYVPTRESPREDSDPNVFTVGAQYGQRGMKYMHPTQSRGADSGSIVTTCPWGYKLTSDRMCIDIDECAKNMSQCGPEQQCENFYGGYTCQCPAGHKLQRFGQNQCEDIDECSYGKPCPYYSECVNMPGSYRCACGAGYRNAPANDKICVDVDECSDTPHICEHGCSNVWGGYRCTCKRGYRLDNDNRTCVDVDECAEWSSSRHRGRLCGGDCVNEPGSYRCACPGGYRLSEDGRSCIDVNECDSGEASCAHGETGEVCQNTRGGYHCHRIDCPRGYRLESKHRCTRIQRSCPVGDWSCLHQPSTYSYNFITFVANIYLPLGSVDLFTMNGPAWHDSVVNFEMRMIDVQASPGVRPADISCFDTRSTGNVCVISLLCSLGGPQVAELELTMSLYQRGHYAGSAVARLIVIVSQYEF